LAQFFPAAVTKNGKARNMRLNAGAMAALKTLQKRSLKRKRPRFC